ncbi:MAG TPA: hypothetical protein DCY78_05410 [Acidimicrobiaceae bacterium]|nr:hypothetical protein [Acidimicrobiaceae bacterium]
MNPAPAAPLPDALLRLVDVLVPNAIELAQLVGAEPGGDLDEVVAQARSLPVDTVVVTMGAAGALLVSADDHLVVPAPTIHPLDTTGAGDSFCGALAEALARGVDLSAAVERAVHAGAVTATRPGAQPAMPTTADIEASMSGRAGTL